MPDKQYWKDKQRREMRFGKMWLIAAAIAIILIVTSLEFELSKTGKMLWILGSLVVAGIAAYLITNWYRITTKNRDAERKKLISYLDRVAPMPDHDPNESEEVRTKKRDAAFLNRIRSAFSLAEKEKGRPLTQGEQRRIENLIGIYEGDYVSDTGDTIETFISTAFDTVKEVADNQLEAVEAELEEHFSKKAAYFSRLDKADLAVLPVESRLARYQAIKKLYEDPAQIVVEPENDVAAESEPLPEEDTSPLIDESFLAEIESEKALDDFHDLQQAKIKVEFEHDPKRMRERLKVLNNLILRYRHSKGW